VFGHDATPLLKNQTRGSYMWWKHTDPSPDKQDQASSRNYGVFTTIRKYNLHQGSGVWARYYFVLGDDVADVAARIADRCLLDDATLIPFDYTEDSTPLVGYRYTGSGTEFRIAVDFRSPQFFLYAHPVNGSFPIYEVIENDQRRYLTWNPYATGVIKTYDGTLAGIRLLGFALRTADVSGRSYSYKSLDAVMASAMINYIASGEALSVRSKF